MSRTCRHISESVHPKRPSLPIPMRLSTPDMVETGISSSSAISGLLNRNRRNAVIAATRSALVWRAWRLGAELRSHKPPSL